MKSYVQGLITGAVLIFAFMVLMDETGSRNQVGTYKAVIAEHIGSMGMLNTETGVFTGLINDKTEVIMWDLVNHTKEIQSIKPAPKTVIGY